MSETSISLLVPALALGFVNLLWVWFFVREEMSGPRHDFDSSYFPA